MNKRNYLIILLILFFVFPKKALSQEGFSIGMIGGYGFSQYYFVHYVEQDLVPVQQVGFVFSHMNEKNAGSQIRFLWTQKAWLEKYSEEYKKQILMNYYEIPLLTTFKIGKKHSALLINLGLHVSFLQNSSLTVTGEGDTTGYINYDNPDYSNFNFGLNGGIGYQLSMGRNIFQLELLYSQSLKNIFPRDYMEIYRSLNQTLYANVIYKISLAKRKKLKTSDKGNL